MEITFKLKQEYLYEKTILLLPYAILLSLLTLSDNFDLRLLALFLCMMCFVAILSSIETICGNCFVASSLSVNNLNFLTALRIVFA